MADTVTVTIPAGYTTVPPLVVPVPRVTARLVYADPGQSPASEAVRDIVEGWSTFYEDSASFLAALRARCHTEEG